MMGMDGRAILRCLRYSLGSLALILAAGLSVLGIESSKALAQAQSQVGVPSGDPRIEERARAIGKELRCVVCQNQSIDESNAPLALDLKQLLRERLTVGDSDAQAKAFMVSRYGNFVLLKPPFQLNTLLLWIGPFLLLALAGSSVRHYFTRRQTVGEFSAPTLTTDEIKRVDALLKKGSNK
jgi:cytochrome c-type biogenesis protein CcmH